MQRLSLVGSDAAVMSAVGSSYLAPLHWPFEPLSDIPLTHGSLRPIGVGDLLLVRQHVKEYEGADVAHIENVLRTEQLQRSTRRLDRTTTTDTVTTENDVETERDTQSTERYSLSREVSDTIKTDASLKAGLSVDAKYGPMVEVKSNVDLSTSTAVEQSTKTATQYSKELVSRSVQKITQKLVETRSTTTLHEYEETYQHGFDNTSGAANVSGVYQWVNRVDQAQIYNYGKRLLFDAVVPEPAAFYIWAAQNQVAQAQSLSKPQAFTARPSDLDEGAAQYWASLYQATDLQPAPPAFKTFAGQFDGSSDQDPELVSKSASIALDDGYEAIAARTASQATGHDDYFWRLLVGANTIDPWNQTSTYRGMNNETGVVPVSMVSRNVNAFAVTVEILAQRSDGAYSAWQYKTHATLTQAYQTLLNNYLNELANAQAQAADAVTGRNPAANAAVINAELRKACVAELTGQQFDVFGSVNSASDGSPQLDLTRAQDQGTYIRFLEQAFEWEHLTYFLYPYFWARHGTWRDRSMFDDVDPDFASFLRAGAARVVFPVRPGFETAVVHFLETGQIWDGGSAPDISSSMYVPIVTEIQQAEGAPGSEVAVGDPWDVTVPTELVRLRHDDALPTWVLQPDGTWLGQGS
jgi:hypothetical protein